MTSSPPSEPKKVPLRIRLPFATEDEFVDRYGVHVGKGGVFIATRSAKPEGTPLSFEFVLADGARLMRGEGVVHQVVVDEQPGRSGMTVRFTRIDARTRALIDRIVATREGAARAEPPPAPAAPPEPAPAVVTTGEWKLKIPPAPTTSKPVELANDIVLGIDLGTTTCRVAAFVEGVPRLLAIASERGAAMPSIVALDHAKDRLLVGSAARRYRVDHPERTVAGFKRLMGRRARSKRIKELEARLPFKIAPDPEGDCGIEIGNRVFPLPELAAELLKELKNAAQNELGRPLSRAVLCVPAWYNDHQRSAVLEAGKLAGLEVLRILNEPSAVALAFGYGKGLARKRVLVYDLGGGTFDASVVEITGDDIEVVSTGGDNFLGGMDFDARLADALVATMDETPRNRLMDSPMSMERVRDAAELAKIALSEKTTAPVHVPFASTGDDGKPVDLRVDVERPYLEQNTNDLVERTIEVTQVVLEAAKLTVQSLDEVVMVGGQSRSPAVRSRLEASLGRKPRTDIDPQGAVAMGAALLGHSLVLRERGKSGIQLAEVLSAPIGIGVRGGGFRKVLERNTRLPAEKTLTVPVQSAQAIRLAVFQGQSPKAEDNDYLGALTTSVDRSGDLSLRFSVSADGRLLLTATTPSGKTADVMFATQEANDTTTAQLLAEAPLPGESEKPVSNKSGFFKKLFGR
ncbi:MAG: TIGR02266 family protein [Archangiaceae bacterium]|nr:TIGR02266 family protein [Archangiaceae bacterium]